MDLSIIIPTKLAHNHIFDCLSGIKKCTERVNYEIIIVVNKDFDGIMKKRVVNRLKKYNDSHVKIRWQKKDLGIAGAINKGIDLAQGKYIFITNDDIELKEKNWFEKYKNFFVKYPCLGSIGFKGNCTGFRLSGIPLSLCKKIEKLVKEIKPYNNCQKIKNREKKLNFIKTKNPKTFKKHPQKVAIYHERYWPYIAEVGFNHTCSIFTTKKILLEVGKFDEIYWPYGDEDRFFGFTLLAYGYRNFRVPLRHIHYGDAKGWAKSGGATFNLLRGKKTYKKVRLRQAKIKGIDTRVREKYNYLIKNLDRKNCPWKERCFNKTDSTFYYENSTYLT